jgi:DNA-binding GntR family transcriptional regulator
VEAIAIRPTDSTQNAVLQPLVRERSALVSNVADVLREAIVREDLQTGERLNQVQIAEQLGVSRMPVREAIATLIAEGLLEPLATGGVVVRPLSKQDVLDVYAVRVALETEAARWIIKQNKASGAQRLDKVLSSHRLSIPHYETSQLLEVDRLFHRALLDSTGNPYFSKALVPVWSVVERAMYAVLQVPEIITTVWEEHEAIADAIRQGDATLADERIRQHLGHGSKAMAELVVPK